ncbi:MAG: GDP-L-fucose synthase, partial [Gammaproteobacteria bacterium]|nr:GDP-L-fucose synthase [Gammaproteobacteria bacterium]
QTHPRLSHINIGAGEDITIGKLARMIAEITGFEGKIVFDATKPDGAPQKRLEVSRLTALGWKPRIGLREGLALTFRWYLDHRDRIRRA